MDLGIVSHMDSTAYHNSVINAGSGIDTGQKMRQRHLDDYIFKLQNDRGTSYKKCLSDMTPEQRESVLKDKNKTYLILCINHLCEKLREFGDVFDVER